MSHRRGGVTESPRRGTSITSDEQIQAANGNDFASKTRSPNRGQLMLGQSRPDKETERSEGGIRFHRRKAINPGNLRFQTCPIPPEKGGLRAPRFSLGDV